MDTNVGGTSSLDPSKTPPPSVKTISIDTKPVTIHKFSELNASQQEVALITIANINHNTSTNPVSGATATWDNYTPQIYARLRECANARNTLFIAQHDGKTVGYVAFYTRPDKLPFPSQFLDNESEAYCSWTAVDDKYRGQGIAEKLKLQIFAENVKNPKYEAFKGHIKKTNASSLKVLNKFAKKGFPVKVEDMGESVLYTVHNKTKPQESDAKSDVDRNF